MEQLIVKSLEVSDSEKNIHESMKILEVSLVGISFSMLSVAISSSLSHKFCECRTVLLSLS